MSENQENKGSVINIVSAVLVLALYAAATAEGVFLLVALDHFLLKSW
jgi:hypothetical protein